MGYAFSNGLGLVLFAYSLLNENAPDALSLVCTLVSWLKYTLLNEIAPDPMSMVFALVSELDPGNPSGVLYVEPIMHTALVVTPRPWLTTGVVHICLLCLRRLYGSDYECGVFSRHVACGARAGTEMTAWSSLHVLIC